MLGLRQILSRLTSDWIPADKESCIFFLFVCCFTSLFKKSVHVAKFNALIGNRSDTNLTFWIPVHLGTSGSRSKKCLVLIIVQANWPRKFYEKPYKLYIFGKIMNFPKWEWIFHKDGVYKFFMGSKHEKLHNLVVILNFSLCLTLCLDVKLILFLLP